VLTIRRFFCRPIKMCWYWTRIVGVICKWSRGLFFETLYTVTVDVARILAASQQQAMTLIGAFLAIAQRDEVIS